MNDQAKTNQALIAENSVGIKNLEQSELNYRQAEEALLESEEIFRSFLEYSPIYVFFKDENLRSLRLSKNYEKMLGKPVAELLGKSMYDLFPSEFAKSMVADDMRVLKEGTVVTVEEEFNGRFYSTIKFPIFINGKPRYLAGYTIDITMRKQKENELQRTVESLRKAVGATIQVMVSTVERRDPYTAGHQLRSTDLARAIATEMGLPKEKIDGIRIACSIHDIGKLSIPAEILSKPTKLTKNEFALIQEHSKIGYEILKDVESFWPLAQIVCQHHERMDGSGYPRKLTGDDILIEARILAVADVVEAMASYRPYRPALGIEAALNEIEKNKGILYDSTAADTCLKLFREKDFKFKEI
jgi:PAS domain S-box-containing protein